MFLFINQDGKRKQHRADRQLINAHSQSQIHSRKRRKAAELYQASLLSQSRAVQRIQGRSSVLLGRSLDEHAGRAADESYEADTWTQTRPATILQNGNSDPFNTSPISIDSTVTRLMTFNRECLLPSVHTFEIPFIADPGYINNYCQYSMASLQDEGSGYINLAYYAAVAASVTSDPALYLKALHYRSKATAILRSSISTQQSIDPFMYYEKIPMILIAEVAASNFAHAAVHGRMLCSLWKKHEKAMKISLDTLEAVLYNDIQRSSMSLSRPCFDLEQWTPAQIRTHATAREEIRNLEEALFDCSPSTGPLNPALGDVLDSIFRELRDLLQVVALLRRRPDLVNSSTFLWLSTRSLVCEGQLVNCYLDASRDVAVLPNYGSIDASPTVRAAVALAALYWTRCASRREAFGAESRMSKAGCLVYRAGQIILEHLKKLLTMWDRHGERLSSPANDELRLWTLYVAAVAEQNQKDSQFQLGVAFAQQAMGMDLYHWHEVREVLEELLFTEGMTPDGPPWFVGVLRAAATAKEAISWP